MSRLLQAAGLGLAGEIPGIGDTGAKGSVPPERVTSRSREGGLRPAPGLGRAGRGARQRQAPAPQVLPRFLSWEVRAASPAAPRALWDRLR